MLSGWKPGDLLCDPMCGSGTIAIEAGMMAMAIPAGRFRSSFGFQRWVDYDERLFGLIREKYDKLIRSMPEGEILCYDISQEAVETAKKNLENSSLNRFIHPERKSFSEIDTAVIKPGFLIMNPPYGERLSQGETDELYAMIGTTLKHRFEGFTAWIISSNRESLKHIGLKPTVKHTLFNGALECLYERFDMYGGSKKRKND